jgi:hypothetical protein
MASISTFIITTGTMAMKIRAIVLIRMLKRFRALWLRRSLTPEERALP